LFVVYYSKDLKALDTLDFWAGTCLIFIMATILILVFGWHMGLKRGWEEAHQGAEIRIPALFKPVMKFLSPLYLLLIFVLWILFNVFGWNPATGEFTPTSYVVDLIGSKDKPPDQVARLSVLLILLTAGLIVYCVYLAGKRWRPVESCAKPETNP
jgi:hypothetical protein